MSFIEVFTDADCRKTPLSSYFLDVMNPPHFTWVLYIACYSKQVR